MNFRILQLGDFVCLPYFYTILKALMKINDLTLYLENPSSVIPYNSIRLSKFFIIFKYSCSISSAKILYVSFTSSLENFYKYLYLQIWADILQIPLLKTGQPKYKYAGLIHIYMLGLWMYAPFAFVQAINPTWKVTVIVFIFSKL